MKHTIPIALVFALSACGGQPATEFSTSESGVRTKNFEGFGGVIAESYDDSQEWWAEQERPKEGSPNVIIFLLDDVGFAQVGSFGGLIETPRTSTSWEKTACALTISTPRPCAHRPAPA